MAVTGKNDVMLMYKRIVSELQGQKMWCQLTPAEEARLAFYRELIATHDAHPDTRAWREAAAKPGPSRGSDPLADNQPLAGKKQE